LTDGKDGRLATNRDAQVAFVEAPTELTGFLLVGQIADSRSENERRAAGGWSVLVPVQDDATIRTLLEKVQSWLRQERISETRVRVGDDVYRVSAALTALQKRSEASSKKRRQTLEKPHREQARR
jgi:hypothetical protein